MIATATERYKMLLANALERVCVLEETLEKTQADLAEARTSLNGDQMPEKVEVEV